MDWHTLQALSFCLGGLFQAPSDSRTGLGRGPGISVCAATQGPMSTLVLQTTVPNGQGSGRVLPTSPQLYPADGHDPPYFSAWQTKALRGLSA